MSKEYLVRWEELASETRAALLNNAEELLAHFIKTASHEDFIRVAGDSLKSSDRAVVESIRKTVATTKKYGSV